MPNVAAALAERDALRGHYEAAKATHVPDPAVLEQWEEKLQSSVAVICRAPEVAFKLLIDEEPYRTWYQLLEEDIVKEDPKFPDRGAIEALFFPGYQRDIFFAGLSLNGHGLWSYGLVALELKTPHIADRATVFIENCLLWYRRHGSMKAGYRATWSDRHLLATVKHATNLGPNTSTEDFSEILMKKGPTTMDDAFLEVHIYGGLTNSALKRVFVAESWPHASEDDQLHAMLLIERMALQPIPLEVC